MALVTRYLRQKDGRVVKRQIARENLDRYAKRIVPLRKLPRKKGSTPGNAGFVVRGDRGDYRDFVTGFRATGVAHYDLFPFPATNGPMKFYSQEPFFLGRVLFPGIIMPDTMNQMLDRKLNYQGAKGQPLEYRRFCKVWDWKLTVTGINAKQQRVVVASQSRRGSNTKKSAAIYAKG